MQEPVARFAVDPDERRFGTRDEVVALRLVAVPPAALDALGAGKQIQILIVNFSWRIKQPKRARAGLAELARIPVSRLHAPPRIFGTMIGLRGEPVDRLRAQARLQALEEARPVLARGLRIAEHGEAALVQRREIPRLQANGLDRLAQRCAGELLAQHSQQPVGFTRDRSQPHFDAGFFSPQIDKDQLATANPLMTRSEQAL